MLGSRSRWEQCEGSGNTGHCSWFRLRGLLPWVVGRAQLELRILLRILFAGSCVGVQELWAELYLTAFLEREFFNSYEEHRNKTGK